MHSFAAARPSAVLDRVALVLPHARSVHDDARSYFAFAAPHLIDLRLGAVQAARNRGGIHLPHRLEHQERFRTGFKVKFAHSHEVVRGHCRVYPKVRHKKTCRAILVGPDSDVDFHIPQRSRGDECFNGGFPNFAAAFFRISKLQDFGLRQNDASRRRLTSGLENWRIPFHDRVETRQDFVQRFILALERAQRDLRQVARNKIRRTNQNERIA